MNTTRFLKTYRAYNRLLSDFNAVKATIICLMYRIVYEDIQFLRRKGYAIALTNSQAYENSLLAASRKSDNLLTKIQMKKNELIKMQPKGNQRQESFETIMAYLTVELRLFRPRRFTARAL